MKKNNLNGTPDSTNYPNPKTGRKSQKNDRLLRLGTVLSLSLGALVWTHSDRLPSSGDEAVQRLDEIASTVRDQILTRIARIGEHTIEPASDTIETDAAGIGKYIAGKAAADIANTEDSTTVDKSPELIQALRDEISQLIDYMRADRDFIYRNQVTNTSRYGAKLSWDLVHTERAIASAQTALDDTDSTQSELEASRSKLQTRIDNINASAKTITKLKKEKAVEEKSPSKKEINLKETSTSIIKSKQPEKIPNIDRSIIQESERMKAELADINETSSMTKFVKKLPLDAGNGIHIETTTESDPELSEVSEAEFRANAWKWVSKNYLKDPSQIKTIKQAGKQVAIYDVKEYFFSPSQMMFYIQVENIQINDPKYNNLNQINYIAVKVDRYGNRIPHPSN